MFNATVLKADGYLSHATRK